MAISASWMRRAQSKRRACADAAADREVRVRRPSRARGNARLAVTARALTDGPRRHVPGADLLARPEAGERGAVWERLGLWAVRARPGLRARTASSFANPRLLSQLA